jgi:hypothetical protein
MAVAAVAPSIFATVDTPRKERSKGHKGIVSAAVAASLDVAVAERERGDEAL